MIAATTKPKCDCTMDCGDDPWLRDNRVEPCANFKQQQAEKLPRARHVKRSADNPLCILIAFDVPLTDVQIGALGRRMCT